MGYTHYWTHRRRFTNAEWVEVGDALTRIICASNVEIAEDPFTAEGLFLNGVGEDAHETFCVIQNRPLEFNKQGWDFCKTARKPYDVIVTAALCYLESCWTDQFSVGSDGDDTDWDEGLTLARRALPEKGNVLRIPSEVHWESQWTGGVYGKTYAVRNHKSGPLCVTKGSQILGYFPAICTPQVVERLKERPSFGQIGEIEKKTDRIIRNLLTYPELVDGDPQ